MEQKEQKPKLSELVTEFITAERAAGFRAGTLEFYDNRLGLLLKFSKQNEVGCIEELTPARVNDYLIWLEQTGHNQGGKFAAFRAMKTLMLWYERVYEPAGYRNPLRKVKAPPKPKQLLDPIPLDVIRKLVAACPQSYTGRRDRVILYFLLDTGLRAQEFLDLDLDDISLARGEARVRHGKGNKSRNVYFGKKTKQLLRRYLDERIGASPALWQTSTGQRLSYAGLRDLIVDRAAVAGVKAPALHAFRRTFALTALRNGMNIFTLQRLLGHATLETTRIYLNQTDEDLQVDHMRASPADRL